MEKKYEKVYHSIEDKFWWFVGRRHTIHAILNKIPVGARILDIGCSSGRLLYELRERGHDVNNLYGVDISPEGIEECKRNGIEHAYQMDAQNIELPENSFDFIISSDCLEHLSDDRKALACWNRLIKKGGTMVVFVPAFMMLWSQHDEVNQHYRRYTSPELSGKIKEAGFAIIRTGYWNFFLFLPILAVRMVKIAVDKVFNPAQKSITGDLALPPAPVNAALLALIRFEAALMHFVRFPFGVSTFCVAKK